MTNDRAADVIARLVGEALEQRDDVRVDTREQLLNWVAKDLRASQTEQQRLADERDAARFAERVRARVQAARAMTALPSHVARLRAPALRATVQQSVPVAAAAGCVPLLDLAAAAGAGRLLWDDVCDAWLEVPAEIPASRHVAIRVAGDSMVPVLHPQDIMLVKLDAEPVDGDLVVARLDDDGYVVKRFEHQEDGSIELQSFNTAYMPIHGTDAQISILGTVVARFSGPRPAAEIERALTPYRVGASAKVSL